MKNIKKMIALLLVAITVLAIAAPALAYTKKAVSGTRYITSDNGGDVNVRIGPGTSYKKATIGQFAVGTKVTLKYEAKDSSGSYWYDVTNSKGKGGWVKSTYLTKTAPTGSGDDGGTGDGNATYPGAVGTGYNSTISAADIRSNTGKYWKKDVYTKHPQIKKLQEMLNDYYDTKLEFSDYNNIREDGVYGSDTVQFVILYQTFSGHGLAKDGCVGYYTLSYLESDLGCTIN